MCIRDSPLTAPEAEAIGLIHKAVPADELDAAVDAYADRLANGATMAIRATKRSINMELCRQAIATAEAHAGLESYTMASVSYTHLDVYKRQGNWRAAQKKFRMSAIMSPTTSSMIPLSSSAPAKPRSKLITMSARTVLGV